MDSEPTRKVQSLPVNPSELAAPWVDSVIAGAALLAALLLVGPRLVDGVLELPPVLRAGSGVFVLGWTVLSLMSVYARSRRRPGLSLPATLLASATGAIAGAALFALLS